MARPVGTVGTTWSAVLVGLVILLLHASRADAIPAFARKYGLACSTCHVVGPKKLNSFGEAFRLNGYALPAEAEQDLRRRAEIELGAAARKDLFPHTVWPGEVPEAVPVGFYILQRLHVTPDAGGGKVGFEAPHELELFLGGTLGPGIGFFGEYVLFEEEEVGELGVLTLLLSDPTAGTLPQGWLSARLGRFVPAVEPFANHRRRTIQPYVVSGYRVQDGGFRLGALQGGVELYGRPGGRVLWHAGLVNGESAIEEPGDQKDLYGSVEVKVGGLPYLLTGAGPTSYPNPWRETALTLGLGGYAGWNHAAADPADPAAAPFTNRFWRAVAKARGQVADLDVFLAAVYGRDANPDGAGQALASFAWMAQAEYVALPWLQLAARFEELRVGDAAPARTLIPNVNLFVRMNVIVRLEAALPLDGSPNFTMELFYAF